jgi:hypothetical protein
MPFTELDVAHLGFWIVWCYLPIEHRSEKTLTYHGIAQHTNNALSLFTGLPGVYGPPRHATGSVPIGSAMGASERVFLEP